jgi:hypothetical protein
VVPNVLAGLLALAWYRGALPIERATGNIRREALTLNNIGHLHRNAGQPDSALTYYRAALVLPRRLGDRGYEGGTLNNIGALSARAV